MAEQHNGTMTTAEALQVYTQLVHRLSLRHGMTFQGARDMYATLGYPDEITYQDYYARYKRGGIAKTIIDAFVDDTWRKTPLLRDVDKPDETAATPFEETWEHLAKRLGLWRVIRRLDLQARLGQFAVLVLGLRGQTDWSRQATPVRNADDLLYIQAFSEEHCEIMDLVTEDDASLFGTPRLYSIDFSRSQGALLLPPALTRPTLTGQYGQRVLVHASRCIHVAEGAIEDDVIGTPALEAVWNLLNDLDKLVGGTSEMVWKDAKRRLVAELREGAVLSPDDAELFSERIQQFMHQMMDVLQVQNIDVRQLDGRVPDVSNNVNTVVDQILGTIRMPKRRLIGSERGELASNQDEGNWLVNTIGGRQTNYGEEIVLNPLVDTLVELRILPPAVGDYAWDWPPLLTESEQEKAETALAWTKTIATFAGPGSSPQEVMPTEIWLSDVLGWEPEQVENIMDLLGEQEAVRQRALPAPAADEDDDENALTEERE